tara:strand:- start:371 stop:562 length:192 start_codon:yes stop_codon:yes gene_type:complete
MYIILIFSFLSGNLSILKTTKYIAQTITAALCVKQATTPKIKAQRSCLLYKKNKVNIRKEPEQ